MAIDEQRTGIPGAGTEIYTPNLDAYVASIEGLDEHHNTSTLGAISLSEEATAHTQEGAVADFPEPSMVPTIEHRRKPIEVFRAIGSKGIRLYSRNSFNRISEDDDQDSHLAIGIIVKPSGRKKLKITRDALLSLVAAAGVVYGMFSVYDSTVKGVNPNDALSNGQFYGDPLTDKQQCAELLQNHVILDYDDGDIDSVAAVTPAEAKQEASPNLHCSFVIPPTKTRGSGKVKHHHKKVIPPVITPPIVSTTPPPTTTTTVPVHHHVTPTQPGVTPTTVPGKGDPF